MAPEGPLCDHCARIPFKYTYEELKQESRNHNHDLTFNLGPLRRIRNSTCPFCTLVIDACHEDYRLKSSTARSRFLWPHQEIELRWSSYSGPGARGVFQSSPLWDAHRICFAAISDTAETVGDCHFLRSAIPSQFDISQASRWIARCDATHKDCELDNTSTFEQAFPGLSILRLVDVENNCLVEIETHCPYVALSYVWGAVANFRLTKSNLERLLTEGAIKDIEYFLPSTIIDALTLVRRLGLRYLWVDSLCPLQDDSDDLERGLNVMDQIYERSWLTIIAACGHNADAGLPGVQRWGRKSSHMTREVMPGVRVGIDVSLEPLMKASAYSSRAWTFQERVLCRRALYFVDNRVFFRCRYVEYSESCIDPSRTIITPRGRLTFTGHEKFSKNALRDYMTLLETYTKRALTNQHDVLRAIAGIIRRLSEKVKYPFFQGLPTGALDAFLLFEPSKLVLRRRSGFPSYSWAGWQGAIRMSSITNTENEWLAESTWIIWYKRFPSGATELVWDQAANEAFPTHDLSYVGYRERQPFRDAASFAIDATRTNPTKDLPFPVKMPAYPLLQFWTLSVFFKISKVHEFLGVADLVGKSGGERCGYAYRDGLEETTFFDSEGPFELAILSERVDPLPWLGNADPMQPACGIWYNIILLEWTQGVAERRGFGHILQSAIEDSYLPGPVWKEILLA